MQEGIKQKRTITKNPKQRIHLQRVFQQSNKTQLQTQMGSTLREKKMEKQKIGLDDYYSWNDTIRKEREHFSRKDKITKQEIDYCESCIYFNTTFKRCNLDVKFSNSSKDCPHYEFNNTNKKRKIIWYANCFVCNSRQQMLFKKEGKEKNIIVPYCKRCNTPLTIIFNNSELEAVDITEEIQDILDAKPIRETKILEEYKSPNDKFIEDFNSVIDCRKSGNGCDECCSENQSIICQTIEKVTVKQHKIKQIPCEQCKWRFACLKTEYACKTFQHIEYISEDYKKFM